MIIDYLKDCEVFREICFVLTAKILFINRALQYISTQIIFLKFREAFLAICVATRQNERGVRIGIKMNKAHLA
jgi:hypothetical protein